MREFALNEKTLFFSLRGALWLLLCFLLLYSPRMNAEPSFRPFLLLGLHLASNAALLVLPTAGFRVLAVTTSFLLFDAALITGVILTTDAWGEDFYALFFILILLSTLQIRLEQTLVVGFVATALYGWQWVQLEFSFNPLDTAALLRFPFLFLVTLFSGYFSQQLGNLRRVLDRLEKEQAAQQELENMRLCLIRSDRLASLGQLAAGVAHELNNPLTGILGFAELLLRADGLTVQQKSDVEAIHAQSLRCRRIVQDLLQFARRKESKKEWLTLPELLQSVLRLVRNDFYCAGIRIRHEIDEGLPPIFGDTFHLQQVLLNLLTNARDALQGRRDPTVTLKTRAGRGEVHLEVSDNGSGIPKEHLDKIFDPFFTTKPVGKGTGLGLSISHSVLREHGGSLAVESREGEGTTFTVRLPVTENEGVQG